MSSPTSESTAKTKSRPSWLAALGVVVVIGVIAAAVAMTATNEPGAEPGSSGSVGDPEVKQAAWKIDVTRAGKRGKLSKRHKKSFTKQRRELRSVTRDVYDAMFLSPEKLGPTLRKALTPKARAALKRSKAGLPKGAEDVRIRRRVASIAIDVSGSKRATMQVRVVALGTAEGKKFALEHNSALYLSRDARWRVFAFRVDQRPYKKPAKPDAKNDKKNKGSKNDPDKKRSSHSKKKGKGKKKGKEKKGDRS